MVARLGGSEVDIDLHTGVDVQCRSGGTHGEWTEVKKKHNTVGQVLIA